MAEQEMPTALDELVDRFYDASFIEGHDWTLLPERLAEFVADEVAPYRELLAKSFPEDPFYSPDIGTGSEWPERECTWCAKPERYVRAFGHSVICRWVEVRNLLEQSS